MDFEFDQATHIYRLGGRIIPGATDLMRDAGFKFPPGNMDMGTAVHLATQYYDEHVADPAKWAYPTVSDEVYPYLEAWKKFRAETEFKPDRIEDPNVNTTLAFAATLDREGTWNLGKARVLLEIKKYEPTYFTGIQLALQELTLPGVTLPRDRVAVQLQDNGEYKLHWFKDKNERNLAFGIVSLYWYKRNHGD